MKKNILIVVVMICVSSICFSQNMTIKPGVGITISDFSENAGGEAKGKVGFQVGGSIAFGKKFYVEPGLFYVGKSTEFTYSSAPSADYKANLNGVRIPVAVGFNFLGDEKSTIGVRVFGGGSVFFITSTGDDVDDSEINKTNWGAFAGAGVDFWKLFVDLSYEWSMTNIQKDVTLIDFGKTRTFYITAGLRINL